MRLFVAIQLPDAARGALMDLQDRARQARPPLRWTRPENLHLTVLFLGEVDPGEVAAVGEAVTRVATAHRPLALRLGGTGRFASALWAGVAGETDRLAAIAADLRRELIVEAGSELSFHAHVTVARPKRRGDRRTRLPETGDIAAFTAEDLTLLQSVPTDAGVRYRPLVVARFGG